MKVQKLRYLPAGLDVAEIRRKRKQAAMAAQRPETRDEDCTHCAARVTVSTCAGGKYCHKVKGVRSGCNIPLNTATGEMDLQWAMGTGASYVPMLQEGYVGDTVHKLSILGPRVFKQLRKLVVKDPSVLLSRDSAGNTALMLACAAQEQSVGVIGFLIAQCPEDVVTAQNKEGLTALHFAVLSQRPDMAEMLLNNGADVNAGVRERDGKRYGLTPLHISMYLPSDDCMKLLINNGADVTVEVAKACRPIHGANLRRECSCGGCWTFGKYAFWYLVPPALIETEGFVSRGTVFHIAVERCDTPKARYLLERFAHDGSVDVNQKDGSGMTPLARACAGVKISTINLLVSHGADVNLAVTQYKAVRHMTPLHILMTHHRALAGEFVCRCCDKVVLCEESSFNQAFDALLASGRVNIHLKNGRGRTAFLDAASRGHDHACRELLRMGADPLETDKHGCSALYLACQLQPERDRLGVLACLLSTGVGHSFGNSTSTRGLVYSGRDCATLTMLHNAGVFRRTDLLIMLCDLESEQALATKEEAEDAVKFRKKLQHFLSTPRSLLHSCLIHFSSRAGLGVSCERVERLKEFFADPELDEMDSGVFSDSEEERTCDNEGNDNDVADVTADKPRGFASADDSGFEDGSGIVDDSSKYAVWNMLEGRFREIQLI